MVFVLQGVFVALLVLMLVFLLRRTTRFLSSMSIYYLRQLPKEVASSVS